MTIAASEFERVADVRQDAPAVARVAPALHPLDRDDQVGQAGGEPDRVAVGEDEDVLPHPPQRLPDRDAVGQPGRVVRGEDDAAAGRQAVEAEGADLEAELGDPERHDLVPAQARDPFGRLDRLAVVQDRL